MTGFQTCLFPIFFFKQKTAYEMRISDWSSDVCSSDLQDRGYLKGKLAQGRISPLKPAPEISDAVIDRSRHIVGMMGDEPFLKALEMGAEVVLAGRSSDPSMYGALPNREGFDRGLPLHAAKLLDRATPPVAHPNTP